MKQNYFGTDGIRAPANTFPLTAHGALSIGMAAGKAVIKQGGERRVLIGKDTRVSGYMLESALVAGLTAVGMHPLQVGPLPTPAVALLTRSLRADLGIMISASHNSFEDNGIKLFGPDGYKLSDALQQAIELKIDEVLANNIQLATSSNIGRARRIDDAAARYAEFCKATCARELRLGGLRIVIDTANGAGYKVIPEVLWELGAEIIVIGNNPDGTNINLGCGSTSPEALCAKVRERRADIGFAVDGDADRLVVCDETGELVHGDQLLAVIALSQLEINKLTGGGIVGTSMTNFGLEKWLEQQNLRLERTKVGDRHVMERMRSLGINLGGEPSGHIILSDYSATGDALITMLQVLNRYVALGRKASEICRVFEPVPQRLSSVPRRAGLNFIPTPALDKIEQLRRELGTDGRLIVRASGTEPIYRIMIESLDTKLSERIEQDVTQILESIEKPDTQEITNPSQSNFHTNGAIVNSISEH